MRRLIAERLLLGAARLGGALVLGAFAAASWILELGGDKIRAALAYDRAAIQAGEGYRILSAHLVHMNHDHLVLNLLGLLVLALVILDVLDARGLTLAGIVSSLSAGFGLLWFSPNIEFCVGFSGVTHGIFAWGGLRLVQAGRKCYGGVVITTIGVKVIWEQIAGPMPGVEEAIHGRVVIDSHLYGVAGGVLSWTLGYVLVRTRTLLPALILACALSATAVLPNPADAHSSTVTEVQLGVGEDGAVVLVITTHLATFTLRRPFGLLDQDSRDFLSGLTDEELDDYVEGASAFLLSRIRLVDGQNQVAPVRIRYPASRLVRAEGLHPDPTAPSPPISLIFDPGNVSSDRPIRLKLPAILGSYRLSVRPRTGPAFIQFAETDETSTPFFIDVPKPWYRQATDYLVEGVAHVVPLGWDHTLFIAALALALPRLRSVVLQATVFTLAHSVTLTLAVFGIIASSSALIEFGIAVSVAVMGFANIVALLRQRSITLSFWRLCVIFLFGLLHGMGFASVFGDADLSAGNLALALASFNIGVEIGQIIVLLMVLIAIRVAGSRASGRTSRWSLAEGLRLTGSILIGVFGLFWAIQRVGLMT